MKKTLLPACLAMALMLGTNACNQQGEVTPSSQVVKLTDADREGLMHDFSGTLSLALVAEPALRQFLKAESSKQFDGDYDILYQLVRETKVVGDQTFAQVLAKHAADPAKMAFINQNFLDLNIKVLGFDTPVEEWDTEKFMPLVVVRPYDGKAKTLTAYAVNDKGQISTVEVDSQTPPAGLAVVIEESERIDVKSRQSLRADVADYVSRLQRLVPAEEEAPAPAARTSAGRPPERPDPELDPAHWFNSACPRDYGYANGYRTILSEIFISKEVWRRISEQWTEGQLEIQAQFYFIRGNAGVFDKHLAPFTVSTLQAQNRYGTFYNYDRWLVYGNGPSNGYNPGAYIPDWDVQLSGDTWKVAFWENDPGDATRTFTRTFSSNYEFGIKLVDAITKLPVGIDTNFKGAAGGSETYTIKDEDDQLGDQEIRRCHKLGRNLLYATADIQFRMSMAK